MAIYNPIPELLALDLDPDLKLKLIGMFSKVMEERHSERHGDVTRLEKARLRSRRHREKLKENNDRVTSPSRHRDVTRDVTAENGGSYIESIQEKVVAEGGRKNSRSRSVALGLELAEQFKQFYERYPHKVCKPAAVKAFPGALKRAGSMETLMAGLEAYIAGKPPDLRWCNPATWLNGDRWNDRPAPTPQLRLFNGNSNPRPRSWYDERDEKTYRESQEFFRRTFPEFSDGAGGVADRGAADGELSACEGSGVQGVGDRADADPDGLPARHRLRRM